MYSPVSADAVADEARIDVRWTTRDDYTFHYTDSTEVDLRWGRHPHGGDYVRATGTEHYHPPPDASSDPDAVDDSCVAVSPAVLVTRAVLKLWRVAYHHGSLAVLNTGDDAVAGAGHITSRPSGGEQSRVDVAQGSPSSGSSGTRSGSTAP